MRVARRKERIAVSFGQVRSRLVNLTAHAFFPARTRRARRIVLSETEARSWLYFLCHCCVA